MTPLEAIDIGKDALWILIKISAPVMVIALIVGLIIALFQALTQIQEMTLTFVPKILAIFVTMMLTLPFMFQTLHDFTEELMARIIDIERVAPIPIEPDGPDKKPLRLEPRELERRPAVTNGVN